MNKLKKVVIFIAAPLARFYIRYSPIGFLKTYLWNRFYWRDRQHVARTRFGARMAGNLPDQVQGYIYFFGVWEPNLTAFIKRRLAGRPAGRTFVDVGANVGYFSLLAAKKMPSGNVVAIEAFPSIYSKLRKNVELNKCANIRTIPCAAAGSDCEVEMFHAGPMNEGATTSVRGRFTTEAIKVAGKPLCELLTPAEIQSIRLIKIDVEGAEYSVVQGMRSMIPRLQSDAEIAIEIAPETLGVDRTADIFEIFETAGFFPYVIENVYLVKTYISSRKTVRPRRLRAVPAARTDVIFSRVDAPQL